MPPRTHWRVRWWRRGSPRVSPSARRWIHSITGAGKSKLRRKCRWSSRLGPLATRRSKPRSSPVTPTNFQRSSRSPSNMASNGISTGSVRKRAIDLARLLRLALAVASVTSTLGAASAAAQEAKLLPNESAFAFSARGVNERTIEARFVIADGYYLYRDRIKFTVEPGTLAGATLPPGKLKDDQFFGKADTSRNQLVVKLPLDAAAPGGAVTVGAESQGCADIGVCYPPQLQKVTLSLPAVGGRAGMPVEAAPQKKSWLQ